MYSINFTVTKKKFCISFHYNGANSYLFVNGTEIYKFKAKDSEIVATPLCLGNISKDWSVDNMKKTRFNGFNGYTVFCICTLCYFQYSLRSKIINYIKWE